MRIPYIPDPPPPTNHPNDDADNNDNDDNAAIVARIRARRAPRPLLPLDLALLHAPAVADGWNAFLGAIRTRTSLRADLRELAICRVAVCNGAWFEWSQHAPLAVEAGLSAAALHLVRAETLPADADADGGLLSTEQWAVLRYTDEMTRRVDVSDDVFAAVRAHFDDRETVELTATASF